MASIPLKEAIISFSENNMCPLDDAIQGVHYLDNIKANVVIVLYPN